MYDVLLDKDMYELEEDSFLLRELFRAMRDFVEAKRWERNLEKLDVQRPAGRALSNKHNTAVKIALKNGDEVEPMIRVVKKI